MICVSDEHSLKAKSPIDFTDDGIVICVSDLQPEKEALPIDFTDDGISNVICFNDEQYLKV